MSTEAMDRLIKAEAQAIALALVGPAGPIALDRIVRNHLVFFDLAQGRGLTWSQIAATLHSAGAGRGGGGPFTPGHLSAVVWRQRQRRESAGETDSAIPSRRTPDRSAPVVGKAPLGDAPSQDNKQAAYRGLRPARARQPMRSQEKNLPRPSGEAADVGARLSGPTVGRHTSKAKNQIDRINLAMTRAANLLRDRD